MIFQRKFAKCHGPPSCKNAPTQFHKQNQEKTFKTYGKSIYPICLLIQARVMLQMGECFVEPSGSPIVLRQGEDGATRTPRWVKTGQDEVSVNPSHFNSAILFLRSLPRVSTCCCCCCCCCACLVLWSHRARGSWLCGPFVPALGVCRSDTRAFFFCGHTGLCRSPGDTLQRPCC